jgi:hypothetical protein
MSRGFPTLGAVCCSGVGVGETTSVRPLVVSGTNGDRRCQFRSPETTVGCANRPSKVRLWVGRRFVRGAAPAGICASRPVGFAEGASGTGSRAVAFLSGSGFQLQACAGILGVACVLFGASLYPLTAWHGWLARHFDVAPWAFLGPVNCTETQLTPAGQVTVGSVRKAKDKRKTVAYGPRSPPGGDVAS